MSKRKTTEQFILEAKKIHGNKYNYSNVIYTGNKNKVEIICPTHGSFWQIPSGHLVGKGCSKCATIMTNKKISSNIKQFIQKAEKLYNKKYNYSESIYINNSTKIKIICPTHGSFFQTPNNHINNRGCPKCSLELQSKNKTKTTKSFIQDCQKIHGNKYNYSNVKYKKYNEKVEIICPTHGSFWQSPNNHLRNRGCPMCNESRGEKIISENLEKLNINYIREKKFNNCRDQMLLPFDFYLPNYNICIEYDGIGHFIPIKHWGGIKHLKYVQYHDKIKTDFCKKNKINLIRISYKDNIDNIIYENFIEGGVKNG